MTPETQISGDDQKPSPELDAGQTARLARARSKSLFIATPVARHPVRQYTLAMVDTMLLLERLKIRCQLQWVVGNSNIAAARNELAAEFLASDCSDMLFVDDDMGWKSKDVVRLLASDQDVIGGVGRKKTLMPDDRPDTWCVRLPTGDIEQDDMGAIRALGVGTGFMKISRHAFERIAKAYPKLKRPGPDTMTAAARDNMFRFFQFTEDGGRVMSEDFAFCELWRLLGESVWADPTIELVHVGDREFTGSFAALLQPAGQMEKIR